MHSFIEIKRNLQSLTNRSLLFGVGLNDADYLTEIKRKGIPKRMYCPYYNKWRSMISRCYSEKYLERRPTYKGCKVCDDWLTFSKFKAWMIEQNWEGMHLDKDILKQGNKVYCPEFCIFVTKEINGLLGDSRAQRGSNPQGVSLHKQTGKFRAKCKVKGKDNALGLYFSANDAFDAYKDFKYKVISEVAEKQSEPLRSALLRYVIK